MVICRRKRWKLIPFIQTGSIKQWLCVRAAVFTRTIHCSAAQKNATFEKFQQSWWSWVSSARDNSFRALVFQKGSAFVCSSCYGTYMKKLFRFCKLLHRILRKASSRERTFMKLKSVTVPHIYACIFINNAKIKQLNIIQFHCARVLV